MVRRRRRGHGNRGGGNGERRRGNFDGGRAAAAEQRLRESDCATDVGAAAQPSLPRVRVLLQALSERATCAEDQRLDRGLRKPELGRDLAVRESLPLTQKNRAPLILGHLLEHVLQPDQLVGDVLAPRNDLLQNLEVVRRLDLPAAPGGAPAREAHVVRDLEEPGGLELGDDPALQTAEGVHERRLEGVLGLLARAQLVQAVAVDLGGVLLVEPARRIRAGRDRSLDASGTTYGRDCGHCPPDCGYEPSHPDAPVERMSAGRGRATALLRGGDYARG